LYELYSTGKQTYHQLSEQFKCSNRTIQRLLDKVKIESQTEFSGVANIIMDTTYFGRNFGVMVFKNSLTGEILYKNYVKHETNVLYIAGLSEIRRRGIHIQSIICDGRQGIFKSLSDFPVQMCHFHMVKIVLTKITRTPKTDAGKSLKHLILKLKYSTKESFTNNLNDWYSQWKFYLDERSYSFKAKKLTFTHKRLRSAYLSLKRHLPYLFVFEDFKELDIPKTTNALDGHFSDLKNKLRNHNGLSKERKIKFIDGFFKV